MKKVLKRAVIGLGVLLVTAVACGDVSDPGTTLVTTTVAQSTVATTTTLSSTILATTTVVENTVATTTTVVVGAFDGVLCEDLVGDIIVLSEEQSGPFSATVLKVYSPVEVSRDDSRLSCAGRALLSSGSEEMVDFYVWLDDEGDVFIGYEGRGGSEPTPSTEDIGSRDNPVPIGEIVSIADWDISVIAVTPDSTDIVASENQFNDPPAAGHQYVLVLVEATYTGDSSDSLLWSVDMSVVGDSAVVVSDQCRAVVPNELDSFTEVFGGGVITGNLCWEVLSSDVDSLVLIVEESFSFDGVRAFLELVER